MKKFSFVVPIYNTENYLERCLDSIVNQSFRNFDVILVDDGSTDNSMDIVSKYMKEYDFIKLISQKNQGLSAARNNGIKQVITPYFLLVDSDDYIEKDLLKKIDEIISLNQDADLIRFQARDVSSQGITNFSENEFNDLNGKEAFDEIVKFHYVENAWLYAYNTNYFRTNNFEYPIGKVHEDFALTPLVIFRAKHVFSINYIGYDYVVHENSIITSNSYDKTLKKVSDFYDNYVCIKNELDLINCDKKIINSYLANSLILKVTELKGKDYEHYLKLLKDKNVFDDVLGDTLLRKVKKYLIRINPKIYYRR